MIHPLLFAFLGASPAAPAALPRLDTLVRAAAVAPSAGAGEKHRLVSASEAGMSFASLLHAEEAVDREIRRGAFPGAALAAGRGSKVVLEQGLGAVAWGAGAPAVDADETVYDLASLTKVVATTTAVMLLVEDGKLALDVPVQHYLSAFTGPGKQRVTIRHLLTHTSGLPAGIGLWGSPDEALGEVLRTPLQRMPGQGVEYSDLGFVVLAAAAEHAAGEPLFQLLDRRVFGPLGMRSTTFLPGTDCIRCAPTAVLDDGRALRGMVHDPIARRLGGIAGNAGLFSTAHDLARFVAMLANGGELDGIRVLRAQTIRTFTQRQPGAGTRALGWDTPSGPDRGAGGARLGPNAFGHTGFTGTSVWVDPDRGTWAVLLANRTYEPHADNRIQALRRAVNDWVCDATDRAAIPGRISAR